VAVRNHFLAGTTPSPEELKNAGGDASVVRVLFLAHSSREKGVFAAAAGVGLANRTLAAQNSPLRMKLIATGSFVSEAEKAEFDGLMQTSEFPGSFEHLGFVAGAQKNRILREADLFCFPTLYMGENQPVNLIEAMAYGLPVVTTRWRSLPEMFPSDYSGLVDNQDPGKIATALLGLIASGIGEDLRGIFLKRFTVEHHLENLAAAIHAVEKSG